MRHFLSFFLLWVVPGLLGVVVGVAPSVVAGVVRRRQARAYSHSALALHAERTVQQAGHKRDWLGRLR